MLDGSTPWPADLAAGYRAAGWWPGERLGDLADVWADRHGDRLAVVAGDARLSYRELAERVHRVARGLVDAGLRPGDSVVVQLPNDASFVVLVLAALRQGLLPVFALPAHREHELAHMIDHADVAAYVAASEHRGFDYAALGETLRGRCPSLRAVLLFGASERGDADLAGLAEASRPEAPEAYAADPEDVALFLLSGGTTGMAKLIPRTHADYVYNFRASAEVCGFDADTRYLVSLPAGHNFPLACPGILGALDVGGVVVLAASASPSCVFPLIQEERITATAVVPAVAMRWLDDETRSDHDLSSLEVLQVGGARLLPETARRVKRELQVQAQQVFGMAEGLLNYTRLDDDDEVVIETQGRPLSPGDEIRIVDERGHDVPEGEVGDLLTRGPYTLRGYYRADAVNARSFTEDGFFRTGDVVRWHPSGNLVVEGRAKDIINRGGEKISAEEIEDLILREAAVREVAVVAVPDVALGERACAVVVLEPGARLDLEGLRAALHASGIARFKIPERLEIVDALPLTKVGKVAKAELRDQLVAGPTSDTQQEAAR